VWVCNTADGQADNAGHYLHSAHPCASKTSLWVYSLPEIALSTKPLNGQKDTIEQKNK
jgi:hypothetical protein